MVLPAARTQRRLDQKKAKIVVAIILVVSVFGVIQFQGSKSFDVGSILEVKQTADASAPHRTTPFVRQESSPVVTVAYAFSLAKCGDFQSNIVGMTDAAAVLQHSIHRHSVRNAAGASKYDYKLYVIAHTQASNCTDGLKDLGYTVLVRDTPVRLDEIQSKELRKALPRAWCCGAEELIKLYAYTLVEHEIVVHVDIDFLFVKPMDDLFDVMLLSGEKGRKARARIPRERPDDPWPDQIEAFITRDWPQVIPGRTPGFQAGFLVVRPNVKVFEQLLETIRKTDYVDGFSRDNGWGAKGYGAFVGAAAMQGLLAYFYDDVRPGTWVELNQCRFNHMGVDVFYRGSPSFMKRHPQVGECRNNRGMDCEDCQVTPLKDIYSIHYTQCRKPWNCAGETAKQSGHKLGLPDDSIVPEHCLELTRTWNEYRQDLESALENLTGDEGVRSGRSGTYVPDVFLGHCNAFGGDNYLPIGGSTATRKRIPELYSV